MKKLQNQVSRRRPVKSLPKQMITRLRHIAQHSYREQVDTLSIAFPNTDDAKFQWYLYHDALPYIHIVETFEHGNNMIVYAFIPRLRSILKMEKRCSDWDILSLSPESEVESLVPERFRTGSGWTLKPASRCQMGALAKQLSLPVRSIPQLTAYNAQAIIQTTLLMRHMPKIVEMIESVALNFAAYPEFQHVRSNALTSC